MIPQYIFIILVLYACPAISYILFTLVTFRFDLRVIKHLILHVHTTKLHLNKEEWKQVYKKNVSKNDRICRDVFCSLVTLWYGSGLFNFVPAGTPPCSHTF